MALDIVVCGNEKVTTTFEEDMILRLPADGGLTVLNITHWFKDNFDPNLNSVHCFTKWDPTSGARIEGPKFRLCNNP